jgi:hypothetical protein
MTTRDIEGQLKEMYGIEVSPTLISHVTEAVLEEVRIWQNRLDRIFPIIYLDTKHLTSRQPPGATGARSFTQSELIRKDLLGIHFCIPYLFTRNRNELQCKLDCFRWNRSFRRHSLLRVENGL